MSLALLARQFFLDQPPHSDLYQKWQASHAWSEGILPIYEWDSILYVGVTEEQVLHFDFPFVQVICDPEDLKNVWQVYQSSSAEPVQAPPDSLSGDEFTALSQISVPSSPESADKSGDPFASLEGQLSSAQLNNTGSPTDLLQADSPEVPQSSHDEEHSHVSVAAAQDDAPGGLMMDAPAPKLSFEMPAQPVMKVPAPSPVEEKTQAIEAPVEEKGEALQPIPPMPKKAAKPSEPPKLAKIAESAAPAEVKPEAKADAPAKPAKPGITPIKPLTQPAGMPTFTPGMPSAPSATASSSAPVPPVPVNEATVSQIARSTDTFSQMHNYFQKSMILKVDGKAVKPWKWDDRFKPASQTSDLDLDTPSPFRIVNRTAKPYHGYVVTNELNEKFFQEWNNNEIPDHVTLAPVIVDDQVVAMLMGIGDKASDNKLSLQHAEKIAAKLAIEMKQAAARAA